MTVKLADDTRNAMVTARANLAASGTITIYSGSQPASADTAASGTALATFTLDSTPFTAASGGSADLADTPLETTASADGTAGWYRIAGSTSDPVEDGECGESSGQLVLSTVTIVSGVQVSIQSGSISQPAS